VHEKVQEKSYHRKYGQKKKVKQQVRKGATGIMRIIASYKRVSNGGGKKREWGRGKEAGGARERKMLKGGQLLGRRDS